MEYRGSVCAPRFWMPFIPVFRLFRRGAIRNLQSTTSIHEDVWISSGLVLRTNSADTQAYVQQLPGPRQLGGIVSVGQSARVCGTISRVCGTICWAPVRRFTSRHFPGAPWSICVGFSLGPAGRLHVQRSCSFSLGHFSCSLEVRVFAAIARICGTT